MRRTIVLLSYALNCCVLLWSVQALGAEGKKPSGRELFIREWLPGDSRSAGGDGLGPMFNESSCVACHNQGGIGGGGPESKNVHILSVVGLAAQPAGATENPRPSKGLIAQTLGAQAARVTLVSKTPEQIKADLKKLHPDFATSRSVVLHRFSVDPEFQTWRNRVEGLTPMEVFGIREGGAQLSGFAHVIEDNTPEQTDSPQADQSAAPEEKSAPARRAKDGGGLGLRQMARAMKELNAVKSQVRTLVGGSHEIDGFVLTTSLRNTSALYGAGLVNDIPNEALLEAAKNRDKRFPEVAGRASKLKDGRLGRFGWKAQQATLTDFTLTACAVELGLEVPGHPQSRTPYKSDTAEHRHDMTEEECVALTSFVGGLPRPVERAPATEQESKTLAAGKEHFAAVGCAACHMPKLGAVEGLYSDLLLHDMGPDLGDVGSYSSGPAPNSSDDADERLPFLTADVKPHKPTAEELAKTIGALRQEWRTPPLWGCRDSAPYLHDGRAASLQEAIAMHGGEAQRTAMRFFALPAADREQLIAFLKSLTAPGL